MTANGTMVAARGLAPGRGWLGLGLGLGLAGGVLGFGGWAVGAEPGSWVMQPLEVAAGGGVGFSRLEPVRTGLAFTNRLSDAAAAENQIRLNGSGVALGDVDGDGRVDVFLCALEGPNRLFRNLGGFRFERMGMELGKDAAFSLPGSYSTGAALVDVDGDGDLDLLVNAIGEGTRLFLNDGHGAFTERVDAGLQRSGGATSMALGDLDGDGDLDLYVANYRTTTIRTTGFALLNVGGKRRVPPELREDLEITPEGQVLEHGEPDCVYLNDGTGRFRLESWSRGRFVDDDGNPLRKAPRDWGLSVAMRDVNQDGFPDLYVANDFHSPDRIWINDGTGRFQPLPKLALRQTSTFSMSVDFADLDRDGWDDFFLSDMLDPRRERRMVQVTAMEPNPGRIGVYDDRPQYDRNTLFRNRGDGSYAEVAHFAGMEAAGWTWSAVFVDVDLDGYEDVLMTTGHLFDTQDLDAAARIERMGPFRRDQIPRKLLLFPRLQMPKAAFRNLGGMRFVDAAVAWGFADEGVAHGIALADLDGDGDLDAVVNDLNTAAGVYQNNAAAPRVAVRLLGAGRNRDGIGARVSLVSRGFTQAQEFQAGGRYLSGDAPGRTFAWPAAAVAADSSLLVAWRSGHVTRVPAVRPNHRYEIREPSGPPPADADPARHPPVSDAASLFIDFSNAVGHRHVEPGFDDFERQPLLPRKWSQSGPAVAWLDLDGDGGDDLVLGGSRGGSMAFLLNDRKGGLSAVRRPNAAVLDRGVTSLAADPTGGGGLLAGFSNYEDGSTQGVCLLRLDPVRGAAAEVLPDLPGVAGPIAVADFDGDGDLDLFVGGGVIPGRYPEAAPSRLLRNDGGRWLPVPLPDAAETPVGPVTGAVWSDLEGDGFPELIVTREWGAVRVHRNLGGRLSAWDPAVEGDVGGGVKGGLLSSWTGWWTTLATGDFDGDGRPDILAGNWGWNSRWRPTRKHPVRLYHGDFDESGTVDLFEAGFDARLGREMPERDWMALQRAVPGVMSKFGTHSAYARADIGEVLGDALLRAGRVEAVTGASVVFQTRGDRLQARALPDEAQCTPVMGAAAADFDGDGDIDVVLAQNFFAVQPTLSRQDAGRGLLLRNDGRGAWAAVRGDESGVLVYGEQRGCAAGDYDEDGRVDVVIAQNGAETKLYRNAEGRPGLRVRVAGGPLNPRGIGVGLRARQGEHRGPRVEIQSGSGGGSQNSLVAVLGGMVTEVEALWPGGRVTVSPVPAGAREITIRAP